MTTEVLVMCKRCGRPQQAGAGRCAACGGELPEAPLPPSAPATPQHPFFWAELGGGRVLTGEGNRLSFRPGTSATPFLLELPGLRRLSLLHRPRYEALALTVGALVALPFVSSAVGVLLGLVALVGVVLALSVRRYTLALESAGGVETRWELGSPWRGSLSERRVRSAWSALALVMASRGVEVNGRLP
ncbi:MAG TPA: hypothetical protein VF794_30490 [Archangium sp.]|uniref:hypothetical protein n=1 Tax=Archangium sp. TaxID=1872627 RepID=UPI002ED849DD